MPRGMGGMCSPANQQCRYDSSTGWAQKWNAHDTRMHISYAAYPGDDLQWSDRLSGIKICSGELWKSQLPVSASIGPACNCQRNTCC